MKSGKNKTVALKDFRREREIYKIKSAKHKSSELSMHISKVRLTADKLNSLLDDCKLSSLGGQQVGKENPHSFTGKQYRFTRNMHRGTLKLAANLGKEMRTIKKNAARGHQKKPSLLYLDQRKMNRATSSYSDFSFKRRSKRQLSEDEQDLINRLAGIK